MPELPPHETPIDLVHRFEDPSPRFGPLPLWWWSGDRLDVARLCWQLDQLVEGGIRQAVVMNLAPIGPLYGALADDPPFMSEDWWDIFTAVCAYAATRDFQIWLYDQIGFSGANLQGQIVTQRPELAGRTLATTRADASRGAVRMQVPDGCDPVAAWFAPSDGSPIRPLPLVDGRTEVDAEDGDVVIAFTVTGGFDYFSPVACSLLVDRVFGEYERRVGHLFGSVIGGVFQDELPDVPGWSQDFPEQFAAAAGYDLVSRLPALVGDPLPDGPIDAERIRADYHRVRAMLARRAFFDPLATWLDAHGLPCGFDQQSPAREGSPTGGVVQYADYQQTHAGYRIPGNDHWGDAKVHSSLAHARGHERVWLEGFYSSGWGGTLEETYDWLAPFYRRGATLYDPHAVYYSTRSGWFEWAPPSTCWRQPYWPDYRTFAGAVTRLSSLLSAGTHVASAVLYTPTEFVQSAALTTRTAPAAAEAERLFRALDGSSGWISEHRGLLDRAGIDYDALNAATLDSATVDGDELAVGAERYRTVILPGAEILDRTIAHLLLRFADGGGRIVVVGRGARRLLGPLGTTWDDPLDDQSLLDRLHECAIHVDDPADVARHVRPSGIHVRADAPVLHRRVGGTHVITAVAHDEVSGTVQPIVPDIEVLWKNGTYSWTNYWNELRERGYTFAPPGVRSLSLEIVGVNPTGMTAQSWDPRTGRRRALTLVPTVDGARVETAFDAGTFAVVVIGSDLPAPTEEPPRRQRGRHELSGPWHVMARSTLDNQWGDLDDAERPGIIPIQVWSFDHTCDDGAIGRATATFGPFAETAEDDGEWTPLEWSLSRGIRNDPIHDQSLGPNGYVPEEFLLWRDVAPGEVRRLRTTVTVPDGTATVLAVGANAVRRIRFAGEELAIDRDGYLSFSALPHGEGTLEIEFTSVELGDLRAFFALTTHPDRVERPEWVIAADAVAPSTTVTAWTDIDLAEIPTDARVQLSSESPTVLIVNGVEVGRQSAFDPQSYSRMTRVHPYDLEDILQIGQNRIEVRVTDTGRQVSFRLDSVPRTAGGLGLLSRDDWNATRDGRPIALRHRVTQYDDPRFGCIVPRPHPLQAATWLEKAGRDECVLDLVPDIRPRDGRVETLSFALPIGTSSFTVTSVEPFEVVGAAADGPVVRLETPSRAGERATLRFHPTTGRRGGALLDRPITVETVEVVAPLLPWEELGLGAMGGEVVYRRTVDIPTLSGADRVLLDLGRVRGTAEVSVDGVSIGSLFAGPWRWDLTESVTPGRPAELTVIVRGTLAPYLDVASPTSAVAAGQKVAGLLGPVALEVWE